MAIFCIIQQTGRPQFPAGEIIKKKEKKTAVRNYLQAIFLIPGHPKRPDVLYKTIVLLKEMKDKRWEKLAEILKKQHPDSQFAKKI